MKKIIYRILLISLFIIVMFSIKSFATSDFSYTLDANGHATITAYNGTESNLTIPSTIDGYEVKSIANHAFNENRNETKGKILIKVIISEGITEIGDFAFIDCTNLESVTVPESVTDLGFQTFVGCSKLTQINIPSKVKKLQNMIFKDTGFTEFEVPENILEMDSSFYSCDNLKKVIIYNKDLSYYSTLLSGQVVDTTPFKLCSSDLVLYSYKDSTTEKYANEHGIIFRDIETLSADTAVESITLNKQSLSLYVGDTETITATVLPENAINKIVIWSTDSENVATVENGKITAISEGIATITATSHDGKIKDTCTVTVIKKETSIEEGKNINEKSWIDTIKLSELKENEIYRYTANVTIQFPKIQNDLGKNCLIYIKGKLDDDYEKEISMYNKISSLAFSTSFNEYTSGESFCIMYKKIGNDELLKLIENDEIIYLSNYNNGEELQYKFEKYIYNDTEKDITINIKNKTFGVETTDSVTIPKGEIYGFDWMIESAVINYSENSDNAENGNPEQAGNTDKKQNDKDNTQATGNLPQTGKNMTIISIILIVVIFTVISYKKYCKYKDIK